MKVQKTTELKETKNTQVEHQRQTHDCEFCPLNELCSRSSMRHSYHDKWKLDQEVKQ